MVEQKDVLKQTLDELISPWVEQKWNRLKAIGGKVTNQDQSALEKDTADDSDKSGQFRRTTKSDDELITEYIDELNVKCKAIKTRYGVDATK